MMESVRVNERDLKFLKFCCEQKFLLRKQAEEWFRFEGKIADIGSADRVARRQLSRFKSQGWLSDRPSGFAASKIWTLTKTGRTFLKDQGHVPEYVASTQEIDAATINHDRWVTQVRLASLRRKMNWRWTPELHLRPQPTERIPDALVEFYSEKHGIVLIAIEVELTQKAENRLKTIFETYQNSHYSMVLYFVGNGALKELLTKIAGPPCPKAYFCLIQEFCDENLLVTWRNAHDSFNNNQFNGGQYVVR